MPILYHAISFIKLASWSLLRDHIFSQDIISKLSFEIFSISMKASKKKYKYKKKQKKTNLSKCVILNLTDSFETVNSSYVYYQ